MKKPLNIIKGMIRIGIKAIAVYSLGMMVE